MARYALEGSEGATTSLFSVISTRNQRMEVYPFVFRRIAASKNANPLRVRWFFAHFFTTGTNVRSRKPKKGKLDREPDVRKLLDPHNDGCVR